MSKDGFEFGFVYFDNAYWIAIKLDGGIFRILTEEESELNGFEELTDAQIYLSEREVRID